MKRTIILMMTAIFLCSGMTCVNASQSNSKAEAPITREESDKAFMAQIEKNAYTAEFERRGVSDVWQYGIAFCGKKCHIERKVQE